MIPIAEFERTNWDVIIVGTGMGGATLGYELAKAGKRVLFCEKGLHHLALPDAIRGRFAETTFERPETPSTHHQQLLAKAGRWTDYIEDVSGKRVRRYIPFIGAGSGGSSSLYGMALERLYPSDFNPRANFPEIDREEIVESWPITYTELSPYYHRAEQLYGVRGGKDPLRQQSLDDLPAPDPMSPASLELYEFFSEHGLHPYQLPIASEQNVDCLGCQGFLCPRSCKKHAGNTCLTPAIETYGAGLLDRCRVRRLTSSGGQVTGVVCSIDGTDVELQSKIIVLSAGALESPCILLRSRCSTSPSGLANGSGLVGRNLMRHYVDLYAVAVHATDGRGSSLKQLAVNDFYEANDFRGGTIQSFGALPPAPVIVAGMRQELIDHGYTWAVPAFGLASPVLKRVLKHKFSRSVILASIMEDLPLHENHVRPHDNGEDIVMEYRIIDSERRRIDEMRRRVGKMLHPYRYTLIKQAENNERIAHACGTCRFGDDPQSSVLDRNNRAHEIPNLYVVDSSFFPSSGGINPALTIAANALRVAEHILSVS